MVICNCCPCCCGILRGQISLGTKNATAKSRYHAVVDEDSCYGCGACETRRHFGAIEIKDGKAHCNPNICFGYVLCHSKCETEAIKPVPPRGNDHKPITEKNKTGAPGPHPLPQHRELLKGLEEKNSSGLSESSMISF